MNQRRIEFVNNDESNWSEAQVLSYWTMSLDTSVKHSSASEQDPSDDAHVHYSSHQQQ